jgi:hypothetical protein
MARKLGEERENSIFDKAMNKARSTFIFDYNQVKRPKRYKERLKKAEKGRFWKNKRNRAILLTTIMLVALGVPTFIFRENLGAAIFEPEAESNRVELPPVPATDTGGDLGDAPGTDLEPATDTGGDIADEPPLEPEEPVYESTGGDGSRRGGSTPRDNTVQDSGWGSGGSDQNNVTENEANLYIFDDTDTYGGGFTRYQGNYVSYSAEYKNISNSSNVQFITDGTCYITIPSMNVNSVVMPFDAMNNLYRITLNSSLHGTLNWEVTCSANDFDIVTARDTVYILPRAALQSLFFGPQNALLKYFRNNLEVYAEQTTFSTNARLTLKTADQLLLEFDALFENSDVNLTGLGIDFNETNIVVDFSNIPSYQIGNQRVLYLPDNGTGAFFCPDVTSLTQVTLACANIIEFTHEEILAGTTKNGVTATTDGTYYKIEYFE